VLVGRYGDLPEDQNEETANGDDAKRYESHLPVGHLQKSCQRRMLILRFHIEHPLPVSPLRADENLLPVQPRSQYRSRNSVQHAAYDHRNDKPEPSYEASERGRLHVSRLSRIDQPTFPNSAFRRSAQAISSFLGQTISHDRAVYSPLSIKALRDAEAVPARSVWISPGPW